MNKSILFCLVKIINTKYNFFQQVDFSQKMKYLVLKMIKIFIEDNEQISSLQECKFKFIYGFYWASDIYL